MAPSGYSKKIEIPVSGSSAGAQTGYLLKLLVYQGSGSQAAGTIYCENNCLSWPYDIVFTDNDGNQLYHFVYKYDATSAIIYVKANTPAPGSSSSLWMYFGKSSCSDPSDLDNATVFTDLFESNNLNRWTTAEACWSAVSSPIAAGSYAAKGLGSSSSGRTLSKTISPGRSVSISMYARFGESGYFYPIYPATAITSMYALVMVDGSFKYYNGAYRGLPTATNYSAGTWYLIEVAFDYENGLFRWFIDDVSKGSAAMQNSAGTAIGSTDWITNARMASPNDASYTAYIDNYLIRPYIYPEPAWSTPGSIQDAGGSTLLESMFSGLSRGIHVGEYRGIA